MATPTHDRPVQPELPLDAPEYLRVLSRYDGLDPRMVRLSVNETALITGLAKKTLEGMRAEGRGPAFMKIGRRVEYRLSDVREYIETRLFRTTREAKAGSVE